MDKCFVSDDRLWGDGDIGSVTIFAGYQSCCDAVGGFDAFNFRCDIVDAKENHPMVGWFVGFDVCRIANEFNLVSSVIALIVVLIQLNWLKQNLFVRLFVNFSDVVCHCLFRLFQ